MTTAQPDARWIAALLTVTTATGMLDAVSLLHFHTFTGYMTGTVILLGIGFVGGEMIQLASLAALAAFLVGAVIGGRWVRRAHPSKRLVGELFSAAAVLVLIAAVINGFGGNLLAVVATLGLAMGVQTSSTRFAAVTDMTLPAATMVLHGLAYDSILAGGTGNRMRRRVGVLIGLVVGAATGAALAQWHVWFALVIIGTLLAAAGAILRPWEKA